MAETKNCSACQKAVPLLAVRCKYCGTRLEVLSATLPPPSTPAMRANLTPAMGSLQPLSSQETKSDSGSAAKSPSVASILPPRSAPPGRPSAPQADLPRPSGSPVLPKPSDHPPLRKTHDSSISELSSSSRPSMPLPRPKSGLRRVSEYPPSSPYNSTLSVEPKTSERTLDTTMLGLPKVETGSSKLSVPTSDTPPPPSFLEDFPEKDTIPNEDIEDLLDLESSTENSVVDDVETMLELEEEPISTVKSPLGNADSSAVASGTHPVEDLGNPEDENKQGTWLPPALEKIWRDKSDWVLSQWENHRAATGGIAFAALVLLAALIFFASKPTDDNQLNPIPQKDESLSEAEATPPVDTTAGQGDPKNEPKAATEKPDATPSKRSVEHKCSPLASYPTFPWRDELGAILTQANSGSICGLFGGDAMALSEQLKSLVTGPVTGYDLLPNGQVLEMFPGNSPARPGPNLELIFSAEGLVEVRLDYSHHAGTGLDTKEFAKVLGEPEIGRDALRRKVERFRDGDLIVEAFEKRDKYRRVFRVLRFLSAPLMASLGKVVEEREEVENALGRGMEYRAAKNFGSSKKSFEKALKTNAAAGGAHVWLGMLALPEERFDEVEKHALAALETSRDRRVHAEANGLLAVVALYNGKKRVALARFKEASAMDPANTEVAKSAEELKTGDYQPERVAKTAARFECLAKAVPKTKKKKSSATPPPWTEQGLLARGNFPDLGAYVKALADSANTKEFREAKNIWASWECR